MPMPDMRQHKSAPARFSGWRMVGICFVLINVALGVNFSAYGAVVAAIESDFATSRALSSAGISMLTLSMGLMSPLVGVLMQRVPLRVLMATGIVMNAAGLAVGAFTGSIYVLLASYLLLVGPGFCLFAIIPCTTIIGNWFVAGRGRALGLANIPIGNAIMPVAAAMVLSAHGLSLTFLSGAGLMLALLPLLLLLADHPAQIGQQASGGGEADAAAGQAAGMTTRGILTSGPFLVLTWAVSVLSAAGLVMVTQIVGLSMDRGLGITSASLILSGFGLAGLIGAPLFGFLADRLGGGRALAVLAFALIPGWLGLLVADTFALLLGLAVIIGISSNGIVPLFGATMGEWLGARNVGIGMGLCYMLQIPFLFGAAPLAGAMYDATGSYAATIWLHVASMIGIGLLMLVYRPRTAAPSQAGSVSG
jgi:MFS family permease